MAVEDHETVGAAKSLPRRDRNLCPNLGHTAKSGAWASQRSWPHLARLTVHLLRAVLATNVPHGGQAFALQLIPLVA